MRGATKKSVAEQRYAAAQKQAGTPMPQGLMGTGGGTDSEDRQGNDRKQIIASRGIGLRIALEQTHGVIPLV
jgi:hypothetical protein